MFMLYVDAGCPLLPPIGNGQVDSKAGQNLAGSVAYYSCNEGFYLNGRADRTCMPDDSWNGTEPSCEKGQLIFIDMV